MWQPLSRRPQLMVHPTRHEVQRSVALSNFDFEVSKGIHTRKGPCATLPRNDP